MYLTSRDKKILRFIEEHKSITINQTAKIFFKNKKQAYYQARKRLKQLSDNKYLNRYRKDMRSETVYYLDKKLSIHNLKVIDIYAELLNLGATIDYFKQEYIIPTSQDKYRTADALIEFTYQDYFYPVIVEIDYTHFTSQKKLLEIYNYNHFQKRYKEYDDNIFPTVLIVRPIIPTNPFKTDLFNIHYSSFDLENINEILADY